MDIHQLRVFTSVFKNRSFSRAAEELNLRQPTVSNHIKILENELNCRLFDRLGKTIIPTREAEVFYRHSIELMEGMDALKETIGEVGKDLTGKLIVGASTIPGAYLLPRIISGFQKDCPAVSFQITVSDTKGIVDSISRHELFLGIVGARLTEEQIEYTPWMEDELIVVSSPSLVKSKRIALRELVKLPMVLREEGSGTRREAEEFLASKGISLSCRRIAGVFGSTDAVKQAVKAGLGVSILSRFSVADELEHKILKTIELPGLEIKRRFYIVTHKKRTLPKLYDKFLEYLLAEKSLARH